MSCPLDVPAGVSACDNLSSDQLLDDWLHLREVDSYDPLTREAAVPYRYIWRKWINWIHDADGRGDLAWKYASTEQATDFLQGNPAPRELGRVDPAAPSTGISPCSHRKSRSAPISPITRERYGRVLKEIYDYAKAHLHACEAPFTREVIGVAPTEVDRAGQILPPGVFEALAHVLDGDLPPFRKRDKAILYLLMHCGLTSAEVRSLKLGDVSKNFDHAGQYTLQIDGPRQAQQRTLVTTGATGEVLHNWLVHRRVMHRKTDVVFISERKGALTGPALFLIIAPLVAAACKQAHVDVPNHVGPSIIRNTLIVRLYNSKRASAAEICRWMGIKDEKVLTRGLGMHMSL